LSVGEIALYLVVHVQYTFHWSRDGLKSLSLYFQTQKHVKGYLEMSPCLVVGWRSNLWLNGDRDIVYLFSKLSLC